MNPKFSDLQWNCLSFKRGLAMGEIVTPWGVRKIDELTPRDPCQKSACWIKMYPPEIERRMPHAVISEEPRTVSVTMPFLTDVPNKNGVIYPKAVVEKAISEYNAKSALARINAMCIIRTMEEKIK